MTFLSYIYSIYKKSIQCNTHYIHSYLKMLDDSFEKIFRRLSGLFFRWNVSEILNGVQIQTVGPFMTVL